MRNMTKLRTTALTPITLPTWGHLAKIAKNIHHTNTDSAFIKGDRAFAYKQLPIDPRYANLAAIALRNPKTGRWAGFAHKVLLRTSYSERDRQSSDITVFRERWPSSLTGFSVYRF